jgi:hypothetical protein
MKQRRGLSFEKEPQNNKGGLSFTKESIQKRGHVCPKVNNTLQPVKKSGGGV